MIQTIHPLDVFSSVTTAQWAITHYLSIVMDLLAMLGIAGLYARQVEKSSWLGLAGNFSQIEINANSGWVLEKLRQVLGAQYSR